MRITHISDLHFGHEDAVLAANLAGDLRQQRPDLVVISGDFTQFGKRSEFAAARTFLDQIDLPFLAVPGNHDVPSLNLMQRLIDPYRDFRRYISPDLEPFVEIDGVAIAGLKSSRRLRPGLDWSTGTITGRQLHSLAAKFEGASPNAMRVVVVHHPLLMPESTMHKEQKRLDHADRALLAFADMGVRLVLSGHFHLSYVRRFQRPGAICDDAPRGPLQAPRAPILVAQTSSTISTRLRGDPNGYNIIEIVDGAIEITVREWKDGRWQSREKVSTDA